MAEYLIQCWNCLGEYDALSAVWCSCNPNRPTKVCPFCLQCFCAAPDAYHDKFWAGAPEAMIKDREMLAKARGPLGEALVRSKVITNEQLLQALKHQKTTGGKLGELLVELGYLTSETLVDFLSRQRNFQHVSLRDTPLDPMLVASIGAEACLQRRVVPVSRETMAGKDLMALAMVDPADGGAIEFIQNMTGCQILPMHTTREELEEALLPFLPAPPPPAEDPAPPDKTVTPSGVEMATDVLRKALARGASDLYLEPKEEMVAVSLRIDGTLYRAKPVARHLQASLTFEMKKLLRLDTAIRDRPQEGRVVMRSGEHRFDVIAHCLPTRFGESLSLKIINRDTFLKSYEQLGLPSEDQLALRAALSAQRGLILVSAPLFHGCTTTLYAILNDLGLDGHRKIMSIEAQSVCPVPNVSQVSLGPGRDEEAALTTLKALGNIQPDVCVLADLLLDSPVMAAQMLKLVSKMLVVATVEAASSVQALLKVRDAGVPSSDLAEHLLLVLNQRLVRRICPHCRQATGLSDRALRLMGLSEAEIAGLASISQGQGCQECSGIGYKGRISLFETLSPSPGFRRALAREATEKGLQREAAKAGMVSLRERSLQAIREGLTTIEEFQKEHL
ncbi:MAG: GspE/PulE family protein [Acidobacteriota bacterium]